MWSTARAERKPAEQKSRERNSHETQSVGHSASSAHVLTDHDELREWAESRGGKPAMVEGTGSKDDTGIIRLMFPHAPKHNDEDLKEIGWDEFFEKFDEAGLALIVQDKRADGGKSLFNKLVGRKPPMPLSIATTAPRGTRSADGGAEPTDPSITPAAAGPVSVLTQFRILRDADAGGFCRTR